MHVQGFHHLAIQVTEVEKVARFYREVLGVEEVARHLREDGTLRSIWVTVGGGMFLAIEQGDGLLAQEPFRHPRPGLFLIALRIASQEREAALARLASLKVEVVHQTRWTVYFRDPEGNRVALSHHPHERVS